MRRNESGMALALALLLALSACGSPPPAPGPTAAAAATPTAAQTPGAAQTFEPFGQPGDLPPDRRPSRFPDAFPQATLVVQDASAVVWSGWPMEGRDPLRTGRATVTGPDAPSVRWSAAVGAAASTQVVEGADGSLYVGTETGELVSLSEAGSIRWRFAMPARGPVPTPAVRPDGLILARAADGTIVAIKPDGTRAWTTDIGGDGSTLGPAILVGPDNYAYTASYFSSLAYRLQPGGFFHWASNLQSRTLAGPAVRPDGVVYAGAADGSLRAIDPDGRQVWNVTLPGPAVSPPAVDPRGGGLVIVVGGSSPRLVALDASGAERWRAPACWQASPLVWPALDRQGTAVVGNCAIRDDGSPAWKLDVDAPVTAAALDVAGTAYVASASTLRAIGADGNERWSWQADGELRPPSLGARGTLFVASTRHVFALGGR